MVTVSVPLEFGNAYREGNMMVAIPAGCHAFTFELSPGENTALSAPQVIGRLPGIEGRQLMARLSFWYELDRDQGIITICGSDFGSQRTMSLITYPEGLDEICTERTVGTGFYHDDHFGNPHWFYPTPLMPQLDDFLRKALVGACDALEMQLREVPDFMVRTRRPPPVLAPHDYMNLLAVHRGSEFVGYYDPAVSYDETHRYVGVESVVFGTQWWAVNGIFANVLGSTGDPKHGAASWVAVWAAHCNGGAWPTNCTSNGFPVGFVCNAPLYGGHIVNHGGALPVAPGGTCYLLPICNAHNNVHYIGPMEAIHYQLAVWLNQFQQ